MNTIRALQVLVLQLSLVGLAMSSGSGKATPPPPAMTSALKQSGAAAHGSDVIPTNSISHRTASGDFRLEQATRIEGTLSYTGAQSMTIGNAAAFEVSATANVSLHAAKEIRFGPGFHVEKGAIFSATVDVPTLAQSSSEPKKKPEHKGILGTSEPMPTEFGLSQNFPNPFNPSTKINYALPVTSLVSLKVYNMLGQEVATLVSEEQSAGFKSVEFNGNDLPSGMYIYTIRAGNFVDTKKFVLMK